jgi:hypothetical protein
MTLRFGFHPTAPAVATVIEAGSMKVLSRVELGWGMTHPFYGRSGFGGRARWRLAGHALGGNTFAMAFPGYASNNPRESHPAEVVWIDLQNGTLGGRLALDRPAQAVFAAAGETLVLFTRREERKGQAALPAQIRFVDARASRLLASLDLDGAPESVVVSPDMAFLYLVDFTESPSPEGAFVFRAGDSSEAARGGIQVVSLTDRRALGRVQPEVSPWGLVSDAHTRCVLALAGGPSSALVVLRGIEPQAKIDLPPWASALFVSPDGKALVFGLTMDGKAKHPPGDFNKGPVTLVDLGALTASPPAPLQPLYAGTYEKAPAFAALAPYEELGTFVVVSPERRSRMAWIRARSGHGAVNLLGSVLDAEAASSSSWSSPPLEPAPKNAWLSARRETGLSYVFAWPGGAGAKRAELLKVLESGGMPALGFPAGPGPSGTAVSADGHYTASGDGVVESLTGRLVVKLPVRDPNQVLFQPSD